MLAARWLLSSFVANHGPTQYYRRWLVGRPHRRSSRSPRCSFALSLPPSAVLALPPFLARGTLGASRHRTAPCLPPSLRCRRGVSNPIHAEAALRRRGPASHLACRGWTSAGEQCGGLSPRHVRGRQRPTSPSQPDMEGGEEEWAALPPSPLYLSPRPLPLRPTPPLLSSSCGRAGEAWAHLVA